jgi:hypothetical protein
MFLSGIVSRGYLKKIFFQIFHFVSKNEASGPRLHNGNLPVGLVRTGFSFCGFLGEQAWR